MPKSESQKKRESTVKSDKMARPSRSVRPFNFPHHGVTVEAQNAEDAENKLHETLKTKSKNDD